MFRKKCQNCGCATPNCCTPPAAEQFYAQYGVNSNQPSGEMLRFFTVFQEGDGIRLSGNNSILLAPGYLYLIDYVFLATTEADSYMQILPYINGSPQLLYSVFAPSGAERNTFASAGFTTNMALEQEAELQLRLTYSETVRNIDITGAVSVTPVANLNRPGEKIYLV